MSDDKDFSKNTPMLVVPDIEASLTFYRDVFGFAPGTQLRDDAGHLTHVDFSIEGVIVLMIGATAVDDDTYAPTPAETGTPSPLNFYIKLADVDALASQAAGKAMVVQPLADQFWGDRTIMLTDLNGYYWMFASTIKNGHPSEEKS